MKKIRLKNEGRTEIRILKLRVGNLTAGNLLPRPPKLMLQARFEHMTFLWRRTGFPDISAKKDFATPVSEKLVLGKSFICPSAQAWLPA
jgi:hypothetical protein